MGAIPELSRTDVEAALARIDREGVPPRREATKFHLVLGKKRYPPKYVISLAASEATGRTLRPGEFGGGRETNRVLRALGFTIEGPRERNGNMRAAGAGDAASDMDVVRVVVRGRAASSTAAAAGMLREALGSRWPCAGRALFTTTPGGFVTGDFPTRWRGAVAWDSTPEDLVHLGAAAARIVDEVLRRDVLNAARRRTSFLTLGVDLWSDERQAELVAVIDTRSGAVVRWTGKSYPTAYQERSLVQVSDLESHLFSVGEHRVLVLGCHDLNMFSARGRANQNPGGARRARCDAMKQLVERYRPTIVLQHPHTTDSPNIWRMPWACLTRAVPSIRTWASSIGYHYFDGPPRRPLEEVLQATRSAHVSDVVVRSK